MGLNALSMLLVAVTSLQSCEAFVIVPTQRPGRLGLSPRPGPSAAFLWHPRSGRSERESAVAPMKAAVEVVEAKGDPSLTPAQRKFYLFVNAGCILAVAAFALSKLVLVDSDLWRGWTFEEVLLRIPVDNWNEYTAVLHDRPIFVKACTSLTVYILGDLIAQLLGGGKVEDLDRLRLARSGAAGFLGHGPLSHYWYILCDGAFNKMGLTAWWSVFPKVGIDQVMWGPFWNAVYIVMLGAMQRENWREVYDRVVSTARPLIVSGLKLWVPTHMVTYGLIPQENRLLWVDAIEIIWCIILASTAAAASEKPQKDAQDPPEALSGTRDVDITL